MNTEEDKEPLNPNNNNSDSRPSKLLLHNEDDEEESKFRDDTRLPRTLQEKDEFNVVRLGDALGDPLAEKETKDTESKPSSKILLSVDEPSKAPPLDIQNAKVELASRGRKSKPISGPAIAWKTPSGLVSVGYIPTPPAKDDSDESSDDDMFSGAYVVYSSVPSGMPENSWYHKQKIIIWSLIAADFAFQILLFIEIMRGIADVIPVLRFIATIVIQTLGIWAAHKANVRGLLLFLILITLNFFANLLNIQSVIQVFIFTIEICVLYVGLTMRSKLLARWYGANSNIDSAIPLLV